MKTKTYHWMTCQQCGNEFRKLQPGYKFCTTKCANRSKERDYRESGLREMAEQGLRAGVIAERLGVLPNAVPTILRRYGLHSVWGRNRYAKCKTDGSESVTTVCETAISP